MLLPTLIDVVLFSFYCFRRSFIRKSSEFFP